MDRGSEKPVHHRGDEESPLKWVVLIGQTLVRFQDSVTMTMSHTRQRLLQGFAVFCTVFLLLWTATFLYGSFYYSYMPKAAYSTPVHYYYRTDCESSASFLCSYPTANISLVRNNKKQVLTFGQAYQIYLELEMPDSPANQQQGMFMIRMTCYSREGREVGSSARIARQLLSASSSRFTMLRYRSGLLRTIGTLLFLPAFLTGVAEQKQLLEVELFSDYTDDPYAPSVGAVIEIMSNTVQIYSSQLYVHAHFTGLRYLLFNFPVMSALVGVSSNFIFLSVLSLFSYMRLLLRVGLRPKQYEIDGLSSERETNTDQGQQGDDRDGAAETNSLADAPALLDLLQITPTNLSREGLDAEQTGSWSD
ncbi:seipin-like [Centroberyx gerrardi]